MINALIKMITCKCFLSVYSLVYHMMLVTMNLIRLAFWLKLLLQWSHGNAFSPVCFHWCIIRLDFLLKHLWHWSHVNGFSVCILWCKHLHTHSLSIHKTRSDSFIIIFYTLSIFSANVCFSLSVWKFSVKMLKQS